MHIPDIGGLLPVFVADRYEGFEVKTFPELTDEELDRYLDANVAAVRAGRRRVRRAGRGPREPPDHGPGDPRAGRPALRDQGPRLGPLLRGEAASRALRPLCAARAPTRRRGSSPAPPTPPRSSSRRCRTRALPERTRLGPPGVDVHRFRPHEPDEARRDLERARRATRLGGARRRRRARTPSGATARRSPLRCATWSDGRRARALRRQVPGQQGRRSARRRLAAGPSRAAGARAHRSPRLLFIGFGAFEPGLRDAGRRARRGATSTQPCEVAARGRGYEGGRRRAPAHPHRASSATRPTATPRPPARPPGRS